MSSSVIYLVVGLRITVANLENENSVGTLAAIPMLTTTTATATDAAGVTGASRNTGDAVDLSSTGDSVGTLAAIPMLTTTTATATDAAGVTGASRNTRDAVDLSSTGDSVGTLEIGRAHV